jgi:hypothetical protein
MRTETFYERRTYGGGTDIVIASTVHPNAVARIATDIAARFALIAAIPDGEDSAGRQKLRLPTAEELASRSASIAEALWNEFQQRGWLAELPVPRLGRDEVPEPSASPEASG